MTKISRELRTTQFSERYQPATEIVCLPQQFVEQSVNTRKVNFADCAHTANFFVGAISVRCHQYFERGDRQSNPGIELITQEAKPDAAAFNGATQFGTGQSKQFLVHGDLLLDPFKLKYEHHSLFKNTSIAHVLSRKM
jgi:hypothetical protein